MRIQKEISLLSYNTFRIAAIAEQYISVLAKEEYAPIKDYLVRNKILPFVLGGGSNVLLVNHRLPFVLHQKRKGIELVFENESELILEIAAGENWHDLVMHTVANNWHGLENLSLIPGSVGAAPIQNIGAYGVELCDVFDSLSAFHIPTGSFHEFDKVDCSFGYRDSIFKQKVKGEYIIDSVRLRLKKQADFNLSYGSLKSTVEENYELINVQNVSDAICAIRNSKLPDPNVVPNSGSFFKNPIISKHLLETIQRMEATVPFYELPDHRYKIPAAWLIENCGWKSSRKGDAGVYENHALILVNHGNATGQEIYDLSQQIINSVKEKYNIDLNREVNIIS
ncbi:UNVERIFIED_CONTAM: hypothetical protein GTU68_055783 [Idotea baltica]|nr:hypothetical protein [Idotea baltica]